MLRIYSASVHPVDIVILKIFYLHEQQKVLLSSLGYLWGSMWNQVNCPLHPENLQSLFFEQCLQAFSPTRMQRNFDDQTVQGYHGIELTDETAQRALDSTYPMDASAYREGHVDLHPRELLYDSAFVLPLFLHIVSSGSVNSFRLKQLHIVTYTVSHLSAEDQYARYLAYQVLGRCWEIFLVWCRATSFLTFNRRSARLQCTGTYYTC